MEGGGNNVWVSGDGAVSKVIAKTGRGLKPTENAICTINIDSEMVETKSKHVIGDSANEIERWLDIILMQMRQGEIADITILAKPPPKTIEFRIELVNYVPFKLVFEWSAKDSFDLAGVHKERGVQLVHQRRFIDASYRFGKAIKILCLIPIQVHEPPIEMDRVSVADITHLKLALYNNLAICYMKHSQYEITVSLCKKIFEFDRENVKALYKYAIACLALGDYEEAKNNLTRLTALEPNNKAVEAKLQLARVKVAQATIKSNEIVKRMFSK